MAGRYEEKRISCAKGRNACPPDGIASKSCHPTCFMAALQLNCCCEIASARWDAYGSMSYSPSSSSNSPSSSAVASWYCWYSLTRSFILLSASVNSISSMPSPVYQCRNALRRNMAVKYSATRLNVSWIAVEFPKKVTAIFKPLGGISQIPVLVVGNPLHKVGRVLVLHVQHLLVDLLGRHTSTEQGGSSQVATMARVSSAHHILGIEHLLGELWDRQCPVLLRTTGSEGRKSDHEEVQAWEWNKIHCQLAQISIQLTRESEASCYAADSCRNEVIQVAICWCGELQGSEANVVERLVV